MYFGDNDLNQANILNDLKHKLGSLVERVGTIQAPHHGAINNFNDDIFAINNSVKILSGLKCLILRFLKIGGHYFGKKDKNHGW